MTELRGRVALVSGASRGIGREVALRLAGSGARVGLLARSTEALEGLAEECSKAGAETAISVCDVSQRDDVTRAVKKIEESLGKVELLVNNAGITADGLMLRMKQDAWDRVIAVNLTGTFLLSQAVLSSMVRARYGRIVSISSVVGLMGNPGQANYAATKAGLVGFSKSLAREVASRGITVNVVAPGFITTDMTSSLDDKAKEKLLEQVPLRRAGAAADVADAVVFLLSAKASYLTGVVLPVDGGMSM